MNIDLISCIFGIIPNYRFDLLNNVTFDRIIMLFISQIFIVLELVYKFKYIFIVFIFFQLIHFSLSEPYFTTKKHNAVSLLFIIIFQYFCTVIKVILFLFSGNICFLKIERFSIDRLRVWGCFVVQSHWSIPTKWVMSSLRK